MRVRRVYTDVKSTDVADLLGVLERAADPCTVLVIEHDSAQEQRDLVDGLELLKDLQAPPEPARIKDGDRVRILQQGSSYNGRTGTARETKVCAGCFDVLLDYVLGGSVTGFTLTVLPKYLEKIE